MRRRPWVAIAALAIGCNAPGEVGVTLTGEVPATATSALVYALGDATCPCRCGACAAQCATSPCAIACGGARCDLADLEGVSLAPGPGLWALVIDLYDADGALVASACANLAIASDGASSAVNAPVETCP
ncbi:MAG: hypothetical protein K8W52_35935 [Deltaproteobacteria bacterium]|nr:hypothetical protein [Deltaproteobacteria bacterium]